MACSKAEAPAPKQERTTAAAPATPETRAAPPTVAEVEPPSPPEPAESSTEEGGESGETGETGETGESGETGETGEVSAAEARAIADLERAGNLALDLSEALKSGKIENVLALTPFDEGEFAKACKGSSLPDEREVAARAKHCLRQIDWSKVSDVRVTGGEATTEPSSCTGYDAHERVRMLVISSKGNTEIDLTGTFGKDGQAVAFSGAITCKPHGSR
jgi:hypothetical protein